MTVEEACDRSLVAMGLLDLETAARHERQRKEARDREELNRLLNLQRETARVWEEAFPWVYGKPEPLVQSATEYEFRRAVEDAGASYHTAVAATESRSRASQGETRGRWMIHANRHMKGPR